MNPSTKLPQTSVYQAMARDLFLKLWKAGGVIVGLDPLHPDALLPNHLKGDDVMVLDYNPCAIIPITDLKLDDEGILATLSFDRTPHKTFVPWDAILMMKARESAPSSSAPTKPKRRLSLVP